MRWGVQLAKIGVNTASITTVTNRIVNAVSLGSKDASVTLAIGGRSLGGSAIGTTSSSKVAYRINGVTANEAKAIFNDLTYGRQVTKVDLGGGKYVETVTWGTGPDKQSIAFRNFSKTGQIGDPIIDINMPLIRSGRVELKFFP
ncbi:MAG: hypothetical protein RIC35_17420 [Marinoscillum sp.]